MNDLALPQAEPVGTALARLLRAAKPEDLTALQQEICRAEEELSFLREAEAALQLRLDPAVRAASGGLGLSFSVQVLLNETRPTSAADAVRELAVVEATNGTKELVRQLQSRDEEIGVPETAPEPEPEVAAPPPEPEPVAAEPEDLCIASAAELPALPGDPPRRRGGRPPGSKNKPKVSAASPADYYPDEDESPGEAAEAPAEVEAPAKADKDPKPDLKTELDIKRRRVAVFIFDEGPKRGMEIVRGCKLSSAWFGSIMRHPWFRERPTGHWELTAVALEEVKLRLRPGATPKLEAA
jgi:hypothetical protein